MQPLLRQVLPSHAELASARRRLHLKAVSIFAVLVVGYLGALFAPSWPWRLAALAVLVHGCVALATGVMHDANHGSFSTSKRTNAVFAYTADLLGASSALWRQQHNVLHHHYTNVQGHDKDLEQDPFARLAPNQPWRAWHRYQHLYMWPLYGFLQLKWFLFGDWRTLAANRGLLTGRQVTLMAAGKLTHLSWAIIVPVWLHGPAALGVYAASSWFVGVALAVIFQLAHCVDAAEFTDAASLADGDVKLTGDAMFAHQLATTVDVSSRSWPARAYLGWLFGGLDHQVEHHLAPRVPHTAYRTMARTVSRVAAHEGITHRAHASFGAAVASHARWLRAMGTRPATA
jgi:linoleoyl-CoA desaturase